MHSGRTLRRWVIGASLGLTLGALALSGAACPGTTTRPSPTRLTRPVPRRMATRPAPATTADLRTAITATRAAVDRRDWSAADREATRLGSAWAPVRTGRMWPVGDEAAFEAAYARLRTAIRAKDKAASDRALDDLSRLERKHATVRPAPARAPAKRVGIRRPMVPSPRR